MGKTAVIAALVGSGALALLKGISAALTGSAAMLAETFHWSCCRDRARPAGSPA